MAIVFSTQVLETMCLQLLCSAIGQIPADLDSSVPQLSQSFGLSQDLERHHLASPILNHKSTASKVLATQETPPPIPLSPAEAGRRGPGKGVLKESNAYRQ